MAPNDSARASAAGVGLASPQPAAFRAQNIPAYLTVMGATVLAGLGAAALGYAMTAAELRGSVAMSVVLAGLVGAFGGMTVMFTASLLNLRKLRPGFERMARGEEPNIPPVWCPVLTSATSAAEGLVHRVRPPGGRPEGSA